MTIQELRAMDVSSREPAGSGGIMHSGHVDRPAQGCEEDWKKGDKSFYLKEVDWHTQAQRLNEGLRMLTRES